MVKPDEQLAARSGLLGRTIGDFEVIEEIGRGGMGVVFRARQRSLDRIVALKVLSASIGGSDTAIVRFQREAQASAKLHHPNIVPIYAQGKEGDLYYYAMELVSGRSLHDIIAERCVQTGIDPAAYSRRGGSSGSRTQPTPEQLALAETEVLDPSRTDGSGSYSDTAETVSAEPNDLVDSTGISLYDPDHYDEIARQTRNVAAALAYAHSHGVIHRDIKPHNLLVGDDNRLCLSDFGLARVLEQPGVTVTGEFIGSPLYMSPEQISGNMGEIGKSTDIYSLGATLYEWLTLRPPFPGSTREQVITRILTTEAEPPRSLNPSIPLDLETICLKALERDPRQRYQSADEMRDDLDRFLRRDEIHARRDGPLRGTVKLIRRNKFLSIVTVAAVVVVALSLMLFRERRETQRTREVVASQQEAVERLSQQNDQLASVLDEARQEAGPNIPGLLALHEGDVDDHRVVTTGQRVGSMFLASFLEKERRRLRGLSDETIERDPAVRNYVVALAATVTPAVAPTALASLDRALAIDPMSVEPHILRAWVDCEMSNYREMLADAKRILEVAPDRDEGLVARGAARIMLGDYADGLADIETAAKKQSTPDYRLKVLKGMAQAGLGQIDPAVATLSQALMLEESCVLAMLTRAKQWMAQDSPYAAVVDLDKVLKLEPGNPEALALRGKYYEATRQYVEAEADYQEAWNITRNPELVQAIDRVSRLRARMEAEQAERAAAEAKTSGKPEGELPSVPTAIDSTQVKEMLERFISQGEEPVDDRARPDMPPSDGG